MTASAIFIIPTVLLEIPNQFFISLLNMATVLIAGGTGLIGTALTKALVQKSHEVIILSRSKRSSHDANVSYSVWDINNQMIAEEPVKKADYVIHVAGANVGEKRWTKKKKKRNCRQPC